MREDMGVPGFAWTLLLLGTVAAAETDQPVLWLLVGPVPFLAGFVLVVFLRQRFKSFSWQLPAVRKENEGPVGMVCQARWRRGINAHFMRVFDGRMPFVPEGQTDRSLARSAWENATPKSRPVGYGVIRAGVRADSMIGVTKFQI
jgi:hypothetical protein